MGSGGCRSTNASLLCCLVSTAAAASVLIREHLYRTGSAGLLAWGSEALPEGVGLQVTLSMDTRMVAVQLSSIPDKFSFIFATEVYDIRAFCSFRACSFLAGGT